MSTDDPRALAYNPLVPADERYDAEAELTKSTMGSGPLATALFGREDLRPIINYIEQEFAESTMLKARSGLQFPGRLSPVPSTGPRSVVLDDLSLSVHGDFFEKPENLGFDALRAMVEQTPILSSIMFTRLRQIQRFTSPSIDGGIGFEIKHKDRNHEMSEQDNQAADLLTQFVSNCGWERNARQRNKLDRDNFTGFMLKSVRDSLSMDASPIETEWKRDRSRGIDGFYAVDGTTIRLCTEHGYQGDDKIFAVQLVQGRTTCAYTHDQLIYPVRNPVADVRRGRYGQGEPELLIRVVTGFLNAMTHNMKGLDDSSIPKGLLTLAGAHSSEDIAAFKRYWAMTVKGAANAFNLPVFVTDDPAAKATFEKFGIEFNEMYFSKWMTFLTAIACAIYAISPDEINFESFSSSKSSLSGSDTVEKLADSKDRGLRPILSHYENTISDYIISEFTDDFVMRFAGLDPEDDQQKWEREKLTLTLNEMRKKDGLDPFPDAQLGDAPINPTLLSAWMQMRQAAQQQQAEQQGQDQGDFGNADDAPGGGWQQDGGGQDAGQDDPPAASDGQPGGQPAGQDSGEPEDGGDGEFGAKTSGDFGKALGALTIYAVAGDE